MKENEPDIPHPCRLQVIHVVMLPFASSRRSSLCVALHVVLRVGHPFGSSLSVVLRVVPCVVLHVVEVEQ